MPMPTPSDLHVSRPLTNVGVAFMQEQSAYVADQVFPIVPVSNKSDLFYRYDMNDWFRDEAQERSPRSESAGGGFSATTDSYTCKTNAYHIDIDDEERANADSFFQLDSDAARIIMQKLLIRRERMFNASFFTTGVWSVDITGVASSPTGNQTMQWDQANSDPVADIDKAKAYMMRNGVTLPNTLTLGYETYLALRNNVRIREQLKYTTSVMASAQIMATMFDIERVIVSKAVYATNKQGATAAYQFVNAKAALLTYTPAAPSIRTPSAGYIFTWSGLTGSTNGMRMLNFRMNPIRSDRIEGEQSLAMKRVASNLGYFFNQIVG